MLTLQALYVRYVSQCRKHLPCFRTLRIPEYDKFIEVGTDDTCAVVKSESDTLPIFVEVRLEVKTIRP